MYRNSRSAPAVLRQRTLRRRWFFEQCGVGLGGIALAQLMGGKIGGPSMAHGAQTQDAQTQDAGTNAARGGPLSPKKPHHPAKAKRVIFLFMAGAPSHLEMFDYKPKLAELDGQPPPESLLKGYRAAFIDPSNTLLGPKYKFARHGQSGAELSELLPHTAKIVDQLAIVRSMRTDAFNHAPAQIFMNTGSQIFGRPSFGAWTTYGLGCETEQLPAFVVLQSGDKGPSGGNSNWGSGFLPTVYAGTPFRSSGDPVMYLSNPAGIDRTAQRDSLDAINALNRRQLEITGDGEIATRISNFEMAYQMQEAAPELMDLSSETAETLAMYGAKPGEASFANNCLLARRLVENGVRFVQLFHEAWDQHGNLTKAIKRNCENTDQASAALITDLQRRGLLDDTLVIWGGEFGRTPMVQGGNDGRDHHPNAFTMWMAGGGIRPGITYGATDDLGFNVIENEVHVHDLHATLLHLLGFDHTRLTHRFQGRDFRLTDVHGRVVEDLLV